MFPSTIKLDGCQLPGVKVLHHHKYMDDRGYFSPVYTNEELDSLMRGTFRQFNNAESKFGVLRGLHRQNQSKLVTCISGRIYDVAVDIQSGDWCGVNLASDMAIFIPPQYAHGYIVLSDSAIVQYVVDMPYSPDDEETYLWNSFGVSWPLTITPTLSAKDAIGQR